MGGRVRTKSAFARFVAQINVREEAERMKCKYEHDGDCCNFGSPQYMCKCKPKICHSVVPMSNADKIRAMSDEELEAFLNDWRSCSMCMRRGNNCFPQTVDVWLRQPAEGEQYG